jgi:hypothetical protein
MFARGWECCGRMTWLDCCPAALHLSKIAEWTGPPAQAYTQIWKPYENNMTRNITKIWLLWSESGSRAQTCNKNMILRWKRCETNVKFANHIMFAFFSYYFISFSILEPGTRAQARKRLQGARLEPGPPPLWSPGPGPGSQNVKIIWK